jgi:hypothetical protein
MTSIRSQEAVDEGCQQLWGQAVGGLRLGITLDSSEISMGGAITATLLFENLNNHGIGGYFTGADSIDFNLIVLDGNNRRSIKKPNQSAIGIRSFVIAAGETQRYSMRLDEIYDLTAPGDYVVYAIRGIPTKPGTFRQLNIPEEWSKYFGTNVLTIPVNPLDDDQVSSGNAMFRVRSNDASVGAGAEGANASHDFGAGAKAHSNDVAMSRTPFLTSDRLAASKNTGLTSVTPGSHPAKINQIVEVGRVPTDSPEKPAPQIARTMRSDLHMRRDWFYGSIAGLTAIAIILLFVRRAKAG